MILPRMTERRYSITTRRWTSATSSWERQRETIITTTRQYLLLSWPTCTHSLRITCSNPHSVQLSTYFWPGSVYLVWRTVHPAVLLEVFLDDSFDLLVRFSVAEPLPLHQALKERLQHKHTHTHRLFLYHLTEVFPSLWQIQADVCSEISSGYSCRHLTSSLHTCVLSVLDFFALGFTSQATYCKDGPTSLCFSDIKIYNLHIYLQLIFSYIRS